MYNIGTGDLEKYDKHIKPNLMCVCVFFDHIKMGSTLQAASFESINLRFI